MIYSWSKGLFCSLMLFFTTPYVMGQSAAISDTIISITETDPRMSVLMERYNKTHQIRGYRIQIISSSKKDEAKKAKSRFASANYNYKAHELYQQPFFIIKVGDFLTKLEAEKFHREIKEDFPGSFIVPDFIDPYDQYAGKLGD